MCTLDHSIEPRPCARAATRFVTFSCLHRNHWLAHPETRDAVNRLISDGAARGDIRLHAWVIMSNHIHLLATDGNTAVLAWTAGLRKRFALHEREQFSRFLPEEARAGAFWLRGGGTHDSSGHGRSSFRSARTSTPTRFGQSCATIRRSGSGVRLSTRLMQPVPIDRISRGLPRASSTSSGGRRPK
jgi:REP element-mobilizing transposase RayT